MKRTLLVFLALILMLLPSMALAHGETIILNTEFDNWINGTPEGWVFYSPTGNISPNSDGSPVISLAEDDFGLLIQEVTLKPETCYLLTCSVKTSDISSETGISANINFEYQGAYSQASEDTLSLCVRTNVSDTQQYMLRIGLGDEYNPASGTVILGDLIVEELSLMPENMPVHTLIGDIGTSGYPDIEDDSTNEVTSDSAAELTYNDLGPILCCLVLLFALYLFITGINGKKLGNFLACRINILIVFVLAFLVRIFIAINTDGYPSDLNCFLGWSNMTHEYGLGGFYESGLFADYPPAYMYVLWAIGWIKRIFGIAWDSRAILLLIKLPSIICDLGIAYLLFTFARKKIGDNAGSLLSLFLLFSPLLITVSCAWAQVDSVFTLALLGVCILMYDKKTVAAGGLWMLTLLIKPQALLLAPVIAIILITEIADRSTRKRTLTDISLCLPVMFAVYAIVSLPMKGGQSFFYVFEKMLNTTGQYDYGSVNAFNLFAMCGGNFADSSDPFLFGTYKTFGWIFIGISTAVCAAVYAKLRDRKYIFLLGGGYLTAIFMLSHSMHERYIYPAIILLIFAAAIHDSRRLFSCSAALSATSLINIYSALMYGKAETFIPHNLTVICSAISICVFIWLLFCLRSILLGNPDISLKYEQTELPPFKQRSLQAASERLTLSPDIRRKLNKRDYAIMLLITAVYAITAFINLGSTNIPEKADTLDHPGDSIVIELSEEEHTMNMWYYAGYCEGSFSLEYSYDDITYFPCGEVTNHEYHDMFRWQSAHTDCRAEYIKITLLDGYMEFREIGFINDEGYFITPDRAEYRLYDGTASSAKSVIDEFDELPHDGTSYMTDMYFDEIYHARTAYEYIEGIYPYEITHPPLGKAFIALGCTIFGFNPFGWRFMGALAGVLMLPVLYILAKKLFKATRWAAFALALFAVEFMHYVQTRIATIDSYALLFIMLMYLFMYEYMQHNLLKEKLSSTLLPLGLCGLSFALGAATKWICLYAAPGLCFLFFYTVYQRSREIKAVRNSGTDDITAGYSKKLTLTIIFCIGVFIILPACVYIASYYPYYNACGGNYGRKDIWDNQVYMLTYHGNLSGDPHPFQSSVYTWPFNIRPVFFFLGENMPENLRAVIWCMGNPLIFTGGTLCAVGLAGIKSEPKKRLTGLPFIGVAAACQLLPWILISREVYIYHFFAAVPFLILAITYFMRYICDKHGKKGRYIAIGFLIVSTLLFILFYPAITGIKMPVWYAKLLKWSPLWPVSV